MGILEQELKNEFSMQAIDITSPLVTFLNNGNTGTGVNQFNFSSGWNYEILTTNDNYNGDGHWTTQVGATVTINFVATEFAIVAIKDQGHGIMTISIDGGNAIDIDLYSNIRIGKQIVYQSATLSSTQHNIIIKCSGRKNASANGIAAFIDGIFVLNKTNSSIIPAFGALPTSEQIKYQKEELTAFIHFGVNTFTDREWGTGTESPSVFNPSALDTDQWIKPLADAGFGRAILTAKHHDGFCLWNSAYTSHDVGSSPWMGGKGDVLKAMSQSCAKYGIKFGVYLSPWDENSSLYGTGDAYNKYYIDQLKEIFANYGKIAEVWMDGAKGSNVQQDYKFNEWFNLIKSLDPECEIFSPQGPDIRWIGNENGYAGEPCWSTISLEKMKQQEIPTYLNVGEEGGPNWIVGEADVSIRPGWFYHSSQDNSVKSLSKLIDIYFNSVGRNAQLLLNIPPDKRGLVHENDLNRLKEFGDAIKLTFQTNFALNKSIITDSVYNDLADFNGSKILDGNYETYWAPKNGATTGSFEVDLGQATTFDVISLQEYIALGQRVAEFNVQVQQNGSWSQIFSGKTIGYKRLIRLVPMVAQKIRVNIIRSLAIPLINNFGVYKQPANISFPAQPQGTQLLNDGTIGTGLNQFNFSSGWNYEQTTTDNSYGGDDHWTTQSGATVTINFISTKFYLVATKDPGHGIMTISIDGGAEVDVDLYDSERIVKKIVFESSTLSNTQHKVIIKCSGRKNASATDIAAFVDSIFIETSTTLSFINDGVIGTELNQFNFSSGWNYEQTTADNSYGGDDHWTTQSGATVTINFISTKFYLVATKDPGHGIMTISIDGGVEVDVDLYSNKRIGKQVVFESLTLSNTQHKVIIKCSGRKNNSANGIAAFIDGIFLLNNNGVGLLEIEQKEYTFNENVGVATFKVLRKGGNTGAIEVDYGTFAGTALDGKNYQPWSGTLSFNNGETEKFINITIINTNSIITAKNFTLRLSKPSNGSILGFNSECNINLQAAITSIASIANLALNKRAVSSSNETTTLTPNFVTDGIVSKTSRWSSGNFNTGEQWIYIDLEVITQFDKIRIFWEGANATIYRIEISNDLVSWTSIYRTTSGAGGTEVIALSSKQNARYIRVYCEKNNPAVWYTVSIYEIEVYNGELPVDAITIISKITELTVNKGDTKLNLPTIPQGIKVEVVGTDFVSIIDKKANIYTPLIDTLVNVSIKVSDEFGKYVTKSFQVLVSGKYANNIGSNKKPDVIPNLREWIGNTGSFVANVNTKIVIDKDYVEELTIIANKFASDYKVITGNNITVVSGNPNIGDFYLTLYCDDKGLGKEGYYIYIDDYVRIEAISKPGAFFSTRTILQILQQNANVLPKGIIRDYPKYEVRGFMLDVGRKFSTLNYIKQYMEVMAWYKMNEFQIHLNDNYIWISDNTWKTDYAAFRLECETFPGLTSKDGYYTKSEFKDFVKIAKEYGINIISEIDSPGHSLAFTQYKPELALANGKKDHLDVENPNVYAFIDALFSEYLGGDDPILGYNEFHIGTDEYSGTTDQLEAFRGYTDLYLKKIRDEYGLVPRLWGSLSQIKGKTSITSSGVTMNIWNNNWADANSMISEGYNIINSIDSDLYIVPLAGYYRDYLDIKNLFNNWNANNFGGYSIDPSHPQLRGAMFAVWNDMIGAKENGICEFDIYDRSLPATQVIAEKLWSGSTDRTYDKFISIATATSTIPNVNLTYKVLSKTSTVVSYSFEDSNLQIVIDSSGNNYNAVVNNVTSVVGKLGKAIQLNGGSSYIKTSLDNIGPNYTVTMWVNKNANGDFSEQILAESSISVLKACQKLTGNIGFSREGVDYSFNYKLPENQWIKLTFVGVLQEIKLYINNMLTDTINVQNKGKSGTFVFPLTRIGSLTKSFKGAIDEFMVQNIKS